MAKRRRIIVAVAPEGEALHAFIKKPGCLVRLREFVEAWALRGLLFGAGFLMGWGVKSCDG